MLENNFKLLEYGENHIRGDDKCSGCYYGGYPIYCLCGGLIHCEIEDSCYDEESGEEYLMINYLCDRCKSTVCE